MAKKAGPPPSYHGQHFTCPHAHCGVVSQMSWHGSEIPRGQPDGSLERATCHTCGGKSYWVDKEIAYPPLLLGPPPSDDLEGELLAIYNEARSITHLSPRAAAALLRLLIEKLVKQLDPDAPERMFLHDRIERLAKAGRVTTATVTALHMVKWGGNDGVHEGQIDPTGEDDLAVALFLFEVANRIIDDVIGMPRQIERLQAARDERDKRSAEPAGD